MQYRSVEVNLRGAHAILQVGSQRIWRHDAQVRLLSSDLSKPARHPVLESRASNGDRERPDICALGS